MNKLLLIVAFVFATGSVEAATPISPKSHTFIIPTDKDNSADLNQKWTPPALVKQAFQTACSLGATGSGILAGAGLGVKSLLDKRAEQKRIEDLAGKTELPKQLQPATPQVAPQLLTPSQISPIGAPQPTQTQKPIRVLLTRDQIMEHRFK